MGIIIVKQPSLYSIYVDVLVYKYVENPLQLCWCHFLLYCVVCFVDNVLLLAFKKGEHVFKLRILIGLVNQLCLQSIIKCTHYERVGLQIRSIYIYTHIKDFL